MTLNLSLSGKLLLQIAGWVVWQLVVLVFAFVIYANPFSEYGNYDRPAVIERIAALAFLAGSLFVGTRVPV
jgi:hypothetical protein